MDETGYLSFIVDFTSPGIVAAYDELPLWSAMFGLLLLEELPLRGAQRVLDVGCGTGFPLIELAERLGPTARVSGIDPWAEALERARHKIAVRGTPNVELHAGSAATLPFADGEFDLIVSNLGLNNFDDAAAVVRECRRVARPGATLALTTNLQGHMKEFYALFAGVLDDEGRRRLVEHVAHRATVASVSDLLEANGFSVRRIVEREGVMRFASGTALLNHYFIKLGFLEGWKGVVSGTENETFERLRTALDELAEKQGELRLTIPMAYVEAAAAV